MAEIDGSTGWRLAKAISRIAGSKASGSESGTATYAGTDASVAFTYMDVRLKAALVRLI